MGRLQDKVVLVSGGGADGPAGPGETIAIGNGRAAAIACAREGALVMVADLRRDAAEETAEHIRSRGDRRRCCVRCSRAWPCSRTSTSRSRW